MEIALSLNVTSFLAFSLVTFLVIMATKFVCAFIALAVRQKPFRAAWLYMSMWQRFPLSIFAATAAGLAISLFGGGFGTVVLVGIALGIIGGSFLSGSPE